MMGGGRVGVGVQPREVIVTVKRHTAGGREGERKKGEARQRRSGGGEVHSEYGGLVLSADSAFGFLGVHEPHGATLGLRITFLFHDVAL